MPSTHPDNTSASGPAPAQRGRILVVDDDPAIRSLLDDVLSRDGFAVAGASGTAKALELLEGEAFDLVLTDVLMPEGDGFELLVRHLEGVHRLPPVIVMSAGGLLSVDYLLSTARSMGAAAVLEKPFRLSELRSAVEAILRPQTAGEE